jgi:ribonuclease G
MTRQIIVNSGIREKRAAVLFNNTLDDMFFERDTYEQIAGNIYRGRVKDVLPGMQAAFIDIGVNKNAFLYVSDLYPLLSEKQIKSWHDNKLGIQHVLQQGQEIMVQVVKESIGSKGPKVTCKVTIPGRYFVLLPFEKRISISRKINDEEDRQKLRELAQELTGGQIGVIIRTNALGRKMEELQFDYEYLINLWEEVENRYKKKKAPFMLYQNVGLIRQLVRDYLSADIDKLVIDSGEDYAEIIQLLDKIAPHLKKKISLYERESPIFSNYGIEKEFLKILKHKVWLESGGYIIFDKTEALMAIDVNTGKYIGKKNLQDTVLKTNIEAAREIARQLRLRDIGGIIIIDFIDMVRQQDQQKVLQTLEEELARDRTKTTLIGLTGLGLVEMTRKKVREGFNELIQKECPYCNGTGMVMSESTMALKIIREIKELAVKEHFTAILLELHPLVAAVLIGVGGNKLEGLEKELDLDVYIRGNDELHIEDYYVIKKGSKKELAKLAFPVKEGEVYKLRVEEKQINNSEDGIARIKGYIIIIKQGGYLVGEEIEVKIVEVSRTFARAIKI